MIILILIYIKINFYVMNNKYYNNYNNLFKMKIFNYNINVINIILIYILLIIKQLLNVMKIIIINNKNKIIKDNNILKIY